MSNIKNAMKILGEMTDRWVETNQKVEELTDILMRKTYNVDRDQVKKIARVLVAQADIIWK